MPQRRQAGRAGVVVLVGIKRRLGRVDDVARCVKIRIAAPHGDDVGHARRDAQHLCAKRAILFDDAWGKLGQKR